MINFQKKVWRELIIRETSPAYIFHLFFTASSRVWKNVFASPSICSVRPSFCPPSSLQPTNSVLRDYIYMHLHPTCHFWILDPPEKYYFCLTFTPLPCRVSFLHRFFCVAEFIFHPPSSAETLLSTTEKNVTTRRWWMHRPDKPGSTAVKVDFAARAQVVKTGLLLFLSLLLSSDWAARIHILPCFPGMCFRIASCIINARLSCNQPNLP